MDHFILYKPGRVGSPSEQCSNNNSGFPLFQSQSREQWQIVFYVAAAIYLFGAVFYLIFGSGELQHWAREQRETELSIEMEPLKKDQEKPPTEAAIA